MILSRDTHLNVDICLFNIVPMPGLAVTNLQVQHRVTSKDMGCVCNMQHEGTAKASKMDQEQAAKDGQKYT